MTSGNHGRSEPGPARTAGIALFLTLVAMVARAQTFGNPVIGFDEQFYLLVGDRMLHGALPCVDIFDRKPIGLFLLYAAARAIGPGSGGDGFLAYKLVATGFVVATAFGVRRIARRFAGPFGAMTAAMLYILWLDLMEGEGGQSPVFYNALMVVAAIMVLRAIDDPLRVRRRGAAAMVAVGLALQIKYSVLLEGMAFGCVLLWLGWRGGARGRLIGMGALWVACALLPTLAAFGFYAAIGQAQAFRFCNFTSVMGQVGRPLATEIEGLAICAGILSPLGLAIGFGRPWRHVGGAAFRFALLWLAVAVGSVLLYARFDSPHYALPTVLPAAIVVAPVLDRWRRELVTGFVAAILIAGQIVLTLSERAKGGGAAARAVAAAATPVHGCLYVYDGYPALYMLTGSCLPSKWVFPGHLNTQDEAVPAALGTDPVVEIRRILATKPGAIVDDYPRFAFGNRATRAILAGVLARDYHLAACIATGQGRVRLVYRPGTGAAPANCPSPLALETR